MTFVRYPPAARRSTPPFSPLVLTSRLSRLASRMPVWQIHLQTTLYPRPFPPPPQRFSRLSPPPTTPAASAELTQVATPLGPIFPSTSPTPACRPTGARS